MSSGDVSKLISTVKDGLHAEWAEFKMTKKVKAKSVCVYAIGGHRDTPIAALSSISDGICVWEACLHHTVDPTVDKSRGVLPSDVMVGAVGQVTLYPKRRHSPSEAGASTPGSTVSSASKAVEPKVVPAVTVSGKTKHLPPKASLMAAVEQSANYMLDHVKRVSESAFSINDNKILFMCLASAALVRSRLNVYKDILKQPTSK